MNLHESDMARREKCGLQRLDSKQPLAVPDAPRRTKKPSERHAETRQETPGVRPVSEAPDILDPVEEALAFALRRATSADKWDVVSQLTRELEARREARSAPNVVRLPTRRSR